MTETKIYICDICEAKYDDKEKCKKCEESHVLPLKLSGYKHICYNRHIFSSRKNLLADETSAKMAKYPSSIFIDMADGKRIEYRPYFEGPF